MTDLWNDPISAALAMLPPKRRLAEAIAVVRAAQKAGLLVRSATIEGVELELGAPEPAKISAEEAPRVALFQTRPNPKQKVVL
jgi:hypothetical protein